MRHDEDKIARHSGSRGFSLLELLIVVGMISIVAAFAVSRIAAAQRAMRLSNSARELSGWLEKARLDSLRRHAINKSEMASVTINSLNSYSVVIDQNGDGTLDSPRVITIPSTHGARFAGVTTPMVIYYNWRGRAIDDAGSALSLSFNLTDAVGNNNPITISSGGDTLLDNAVTPAAVNVNTSINANSNINKRTIAP